ncbi:MAG: hypothetical protein MJK12_16110 [Colwellia sp.]|nr:hypothetical protein [Colwellia sp.]
MNRKINRLLVSFLLMTCTPFSFSNDDVSSKKQKNLFPDSVITSTALSSLASMIYELEPTREMDPNRGSDISHIVSYQGNLWFYSEHAIWKLDSLDGVLDKVVGGIEKVDEGIHNRTSYLLVGDKLIYGKDRKIHVANHLGQTEFTIEGSYYDAGGFISSGASEKGVYFHVYFDDDSSNKAELLYSDGTKQGTKKYNICPDSCANEPRQITQAGGSAYFSASLNSDYMNNERSLMVAHSDGTFTELANVEQTNGSITGIIPYSSGVLVSTENQQETLLYTEGTLESTQIISAENSDHFLGVTEAKVLSDKLILAADELFVFDVNDLTKSPYVIDVDPRDEGTTANSGAKDLTLVNNELFFVASSEYGRNGYDYSSLGLWKTNGTAEETRLIYDFDEFDVLDIEILSAKGKKVLLRVKIDTKLSSGQVNELWISDGTTSGTKRIGKNIAFSLNADNEKIHSDFQEERFYFRAHGNDNNLELYSTDGTEQGTHLAYELAVEQTIKQTGIIFQADNDVYTQMLRVKMSDSGDESNYEVWQWGIENAELMQSTVFASMNSYSGTGVQLQAAFPRGDGQFWWMNSQAGVHYDLSMYQPNDNSLTPIMSEFDFNYCESQDQLFSSQRLIGNNIYFQAGAEYNGNSSCQLWVSDGTSEGTFPVTNFSEEDFNFRSIESIVSLYEKAFFNFSGAKEANQLIETQIWETDGITENTKLAFSFSEIHPYYGARIDWLHSSNTHLFFTATKFDGLGVSDTGIFSFKNGVVETIHENVGNLEMMVTSESTLIYVIGKDIYFSTGYADDVKVIAEYIKPESSPYINHISDLVVSPNKDKVMFKAYNTEGELYLWIADGNGADIKPLQTIGVKGYFTTQAQNTDSLFITMQTSEQSNMGVHSLYKFDLKTNSFVEVGSYQSDQPLAVVAADYAAVLAGNLGYSTGIQDPTVGGPYIYAELLVGQDHDNDGVANELDALPLNPLEQFDIDNDAIGDNKDEDNDNDGFNDDIDLFSTSAKEWLDSDLDGIGNNSDLDDDNDNVPDWQDSYPLDANKQSNPDDTTHLIIPTPTPTPNPPQVKNSSDSSGGSIYYLLVGVLIMLNYRRV